MHNVTRKTNSPRVAIIGGGASGLAAATHLARAFDRGTDVRVDVYEPGETLGLGIAYSTTDSQHLLNVPAKGMSLYRDDMAHFQRWAGAQPDEFVSRARYGQYLQDCLHDAWEKRAGGVRHLRTEVVDIHRRTGGSWLLVDGAGGTHPADVVIVATGHQTPAAPPGLPVEVVANAAFHTDPWAPEALADLQPGERVLCVGTGLTFIDVALSILAGTPEAVVTGLSRRGRLPSRHLTPLTSPQPPMPLPASGPIALDDVIAHVRVAGADWRGVVDGMRGQTPEIWQRLRAEDRDRYLREVSREWDVLRHRMAPEIAAAVDRHLASGQLRVVAAPTYGIAAHADGFLLTTAEGVEQVDRIVVCTGPRADVRLTRLGANLLRRGYACSGPYDIGYDVDPQTGECSSGLFAIGPLRRGVLFESTAMPEISAQAQQLADLIATLSPAPASA